VPNGTSYAVRVLTQPSGQVCTIANAVGSVSFVSITNVAGSCVTAYSVGGTVSGLATGANLALTNINGDAITVSANGGFTFSTSMAAGAPYSVTIATQPSGQDCQMPLLYQGLTDASGVIGQENVNNITISCVDIFGVDAVVSGLAAGANVTLELTAPGIKEYVTASQNGQSPFPPACRTERSFH
jgi:hypothetical protein